MRRERERAASSHSRSVRVTRCRYERRRCDCHCRRRRGSLLATCSQFLLLVALSARLQVVVTKIADYLLFR